LFLIEICFGCLAQEDVVNYKKKYSNLKSEDYITKVFIHDKYINGNTKFLAIGVSKMIEDIERSYFLNSAKYFYRNCMLKSIQMYTENGYPKHTKIYDKNTS
jgi:hypothetical protein